MKAWQPFPLRSHTLTYTPEIPIRETVHNFGSCRLVVLTILLMFLGSLNLRAETPDLEKLKQLVKIAAASTPVPAALSFYPDLPDSPHAEMTTRAGDSEFVEKLSYSRKATADGHLVFRFGSDNLRGEHSTDIVSCDEKTGALKRIRLLADGGVEQLSGVIEFQPKSKNEETGKVRNTRIIWTGHLERGGKHTGMTVLATEALTYIDYEGYKHASITWSHHLLENDHVRQQQYFRFSHQETMKPGAKDNPQSTGLASLLKSKFGGSPDKGAGSGNPASSPDTRKPAVHEIEKFNYRFRHPGDAYARMDAKTLSPDASLAFIQAKPHRMIMIIAEEVGSDARLSVDLFTEVVRTNMRSMNPAVKIGDIETITFDGVEHRLFQSEAALRNGKTGRWCHLVSLRHGFLYQLILFSMEQNSKAVMMTEMKKMAAHFSIIDPERKGRDMNVAAVSKYHDAAYGVSVDPGQFESMAWDQNDLSTKYPLASWGVLAPDGSGIFIIPADLRGLEAQPDLVESLLRSLSGLTPETKDMKIEPHAQGNGKGTKATAYYEWQGSTVTQQVRVLQNGHTAVAIAAFTTGKGEKPLKKLDAMLDHVVIQPPSEEEAPGPRPNQAEIANQIGLSFHSRGQYRLAIPCFDEAHRRNPANPIFRLNQLQALQEAGLSENGLELVKSMLSGTQTPQPELKAWHAAFLSAVGQNHESLEIYSELFRNGWRNDDDFLKYLGVLAANDRLDEAVEITDDYIKRHGISALRVLRWRRQIHSQAGKWDSAVELARELCTLHPRDVGLRLELVTVLNDAIQGKESLKLLDAGGFDDTPEALLLHQRGRALNLERKFTQAKECLERAAGLMPENTEIRDELARATAMLGQGDQSSIRTRLEAVSIPEEIAAGSRNKPGASEPSDGFPIRVDNSHTGFHFAAGKPIRRSEYREVSILTRAGLEDYKNIRFTFEPSYEMAFINTLEVVDQEGRLKTQGNPEDYYVSGDTGGPVMASGERTVTAPVPGLAVGDRIRLVYTIQSKAPLEEIPFTRHIFASTVPCGPRTVFVTGDIEKTRGEFQLGEAEQKHGAGFHCWMLRNPVRFDYESMLPDADRFLPSLAIGPATGNWKEIGSDYIGSLKDRLKASDGISELARKFVREHPDKNDRMLAIVRFVQSEITYQAMVFGTRARTPKRAEKCLSDRYGDCKDHSLLAHLLLRESGIESQLVLLDTSSQVHPSLPSLDQFNHMIIRIGDRKQGRFFDCTVEHMDAALGTASMYADKGCLVLHPDGAEIETIHETSPGGSKVITDRKVTCNLASNEFSVEETTRFLGEQTEWIRSTLAGSDRSQYVDLLTRVIGSDHRLRIDEVKAEGLATTDPHVQIQLKYRITAALESDGKRRSGHLPSVWEELYFKAGAHAKRKSPFQIRTGYEFESRCQIVQDETKGTTPEEPVWAASQSEKPWGNWQVSADGNVLHARFRITPGIHTGGDFEKYLEDQSRFLKSVQGKFSVKGNG